MKKQSIFKKPVGIFGGINYGLIDAYIHSKDGQDIPHFEKTHGFSFTVGYRHTIYRHIYGLTYLGTTSNWKANNPYFVFERTFIPRMGLIIGYEF